MTKQVNEVEGYSLFNDVKDFTLQANNRAVVLANLLEDNLYEDTGTVTQAGVEYLSQYIAQLSEPEIAIIYPVLVDELKTRGLLSALT